MDLNCANIRHVGVHKEQFDAIERKADVIILSCIEDGRVLAFRRLYDLIESPQYSVDDMVYLLDELGKKNPMLMIGVDAPNNGHMAVISQANIYRNINGDIMVDCE